jgi:Carboxypeptidase regulatory-like domain
MRACLIVFVLLARPAAGAQINTGEIVGVVRDDSGGVLPGATVTATHASTGQVVERLTDERGRYLLPGLRIGVWNVVAHLPGFTSQLHRGVALEVGRTLELEFALTVQGLAEQVVVQAFTPLIQTTTAEISDVIENREVVQLPLNGRTFLSLAQLSDAVVIPPGGTRGEALQQAGPLPNVGGQRSGHNIYLLDGTKITDELFNNLVINPSIDAIEEFKIQKSMYAAEFGGKASALINVVTRAGTNTFRGSAFEFRRDDAFDSANYFRPIGAPVPPLGQDQFGVSFGGPVMRNRSFFFGSFEGLRMSRSLTRTFSVPSLAVRAGNFAGVASICDPLTIPATGRCAAFPNNQIPSDRIDPLASTLLHQVPLPTANANVQNLAAVEEQKRNLDQFSVRLDHGLSAADQLLARFSTFDADETQPFGTSALQETLVPGFGRSLTTRSRNLLAGHTRTFAASVLNEMRVGWLSVQGGQISQNQGNAFAQQVGLQGVTSDPRDMGFPQISTGGLYSTFGDPTVFTTRNNNQLELFENLTLDRGAHRLKFGAYYFHLWLRPEQADNARGAFTYTGQFTGNAFADFLLGYPTSALSGIGRGDENGRSSWFHVYAQDDWRVRDNLTFNLGLRYEFNQHMYDVDNRLSSIDLSVPGGQFVIASDENGGIAASANSLLSQIPIPYTTSEAAGWGRGLLEPSLVRLAPRIGFALGLDDSRAVIRGGYGIFLNQWAYSVQTAFARNLPFFSTKQVDVPTDARVPSLQTRDILTSNATGTVGASIMDHSYNVEYSQTWSGGLQYQLWPSTMAEIAYMGTWTLGADNATVRNVPEPGPGPIQARRPIPQLSHINAIRFDGKSIYHVLTVKIERRPASRVAYNVSYTLSQSKDDASSPGATESETNVPQNVRNVFDETGEWARSSFDHRHQFIASGVYQLPFFAGRGGATEAIFGGWRVNGILNVQSGAPFTVNLSTDRANIGAGPAQRPDQIRGAELPADERTHERWFDTSAFVLQAPFTFGTARRNSVIGPGYANVDFALAKVWAIQRSTLEFRWEVFNLLNRANFDLPNRIFGSPNFGRIFSAKTPREMQFGVRLAF